MKILYIYKEYKDRRKLYGQMMENLGHKVKYLEIVNKIKANQISEKHIKKYKPDLIWLLNIYYMSHGAISKSALEYIKFKKIPIVVYGTFDTVVPYTASLDVWKNIDYAFVHHSPMCQFLRKNNINSYHMPLGFYPSQYNKKNKDKTIDVSFMGNSLNQIPLNKNKRIIYLQSLSKFNIKVYGADFIDKLKDIKVETFGKHHVQRSVYAKTKINLGLPFVNSKCKFYENVYHGKNRLFEVPATSNFLLTVKCPEFLDIFGDTIGYYDDNVESFNESIKRYLKDQKIAKKMAKKAFKLVHQKHTYEHRFKEMFDIINS